MKILCLQGERSLSESERTPYETQEAVHAEYVIILTNIDVLMYCNFLKKVTNLIIPAMGEKFKGKRKDILRNTKGSA